MKKTFRQLSIFLSILWFCCKPSIAAEEPKLAALNVLNKVELEGNENSIELTVKAAEAPIYNIYQLESPFRIVVDFPDTKSSVSLPNSYKTISEIRDVTLKQINTATSSMVRIVMAFNKRVGFDVKPKEKNLVVVIDRTGKQRELAGNVNPADSANFTDSSLSIQKLNVSQKEDVLQTAIEGNRAIEKFHHFPLSSPQRIVVDIDDAISALSSSQFIVNQGALKKIRVGKSQNRLRLVFDLTYKASYSVVSTSRGLQVNIEGASPVESSVPDAGGSGVVLNSVNFITVGNNPRVVLALSGNSEYRSYELADKLVFELEGVRPSRQLEPTFDTRSYKTSIAGIAVKEIAGESDTQKMTQVQLTLSSRSKYSIKQNGNNLVVDFEDSPRLAAGDSVKESAALDQSTAIARKLEKKGQIITESGEVMSVDSMEKGEKKKSDGASLNRYQSEDVFQRLREKYLDQKISVNFQETGVKDIIDVLAEVSKFNILMADDVSGTVSLKLDNVSWVQVMELVLEAKQLGLVRIGGNIIRIAPKEVLEQERIEAFQAIKLKKAQEPLQTLLIPVSYAKATEISAKVTELLFDVIKEEGKAIAVGARITVDERTNSLLIRDTSENIRQALKIIEELDTQTKQISIEARIVEATTSFSKALGIQWGSALNFDSTRGNPLGLFFPNSVNLVGSHSNQLADIPNTVVNLPTGGNIAGTLSIGSINGLVDLDLRLATLENWGEGKTISSPKITVLDNNSATISTGAQVPLVTSSPNSGQTVNLATAATTLTILPRVVGDGSVIMQVNATRNAPDFSNLVQGNPTITTNTATTQLLVKSGNTTVIGGIYVIEESESHEGVPILSHIPVIGWLFKNVTRVKNRRELLIFITPRIIMDSREAIEG